MIKFKYDEKKIFYGWISNKKNFKYKLRKFDDEKKIYIYQLNEYFYFLFRKTDKIINFNLLKY